VQDSRAFAREWIEAWNAHDLDRILSHYDDDVVLTSPIVQRRLKEPSGTVHGKPRLRAYFAAGLAARPNLSFQLRRTYAGVSSLTLEYVAADGQLAAEFMEFGDNGLVRRVVAHYAETI
jgi:hypothetical protein